MNKDNNQVLTAQSGKPVDVGVYLDNLYRQGHLSSYFSDRMRTGGNHDTIVPKSKIDHDIKQLIKDHLGDKSIYTEGATYIRSEDVVLMKAKFMKEKEIMNDTEIDSTTAVFNEWSVFFDCPFCNEKHHQLATPEIVLGGASEYESKCSVGYAPDSYIVTLKYDCDFLPYKAIHWARDEVEINSAQFNEALLPSNISQDQMEEAHHYGWDFYEHP
jgi:hypothetical protein